MVGSVNTLLVVALSVIGAFVSEYTEQLSRMLRLSNDLAKDLEWIRAENKRLAEEATVIEAECILRGIDKAPGF